MRSIALLVVGAVACAPAAAPLKGGLAPDRSLPSLSLPTGHRQIVIKWDYEEGESAGRGDGGERTSAPDSARRDFFLGRGPCAGTAGGLPWAHPSTASP